MDSLKCARCGKDIDEGYAGQLCVKCDDEVWTGYSDQDWEGIDE
jgi:DNA-directed RNA polymerase subunit RPC12/RpoP